MDPVLNKGQALAVPDVVSSFLTVDSLARLEIIQTSAPIALIVNWTHSAWKTTVINLQTQMYYMHPSHPLNQATNVQQIRPMRQSVRLRCTGRADTLQGIFRVIHLPEGLQWEKNSQTGGQISPGMVNQINNLISNNTGVRTYTAAQAFGQSLAFQCFPASHIGMKVAQQYTSIPASDDQVQAFFNDSAINKGLGALLFYFAGTSDNQNWDVAVHAQDALTYAPDTFEGTLQRPSKTANYKTFMAKIMHGNKHGGDHMPLGYPKSVRATPSHQQSLFS